MAIPLARQCSSAQVRFSWRACCSLAVVLGLHWTVRAWDSNASVQRLVGRLYAAPHASSSHNCEVRADNGAVDCWGANGAGQRTVPERAGAFYPVNSGESHSCGILLDGRTAVCWGYDSDNRSSPPADVEFRSVSAGVYNACGVRVCEPRRRLSLRRSIGRCHCDVSGLRGLWPGVWGASYPRCAWSQLRRLGSLRSGPSWRGVLLGE